MGPCSLVYSPVNSGGFKARFPLSPHLKPPEPPTQFCQPLPSQPWFPHLLCFPDCVPLWCECPILWCEWPNRKHGEEKVFVAPAYVTVLQNTSSVSWDYRSQGPFFQDLLQFPCPSSSDFCIRGDNRSIGSEWSTCPYTVTPRKAGTSVTPLDPLHFGVHVRKKKNEYVWCSEFSFPGVYLSVTLNWWDPHLIGSQGL